MGKEYPFVEDTLGKKLRAGTGLSVDCLTCRRQAVLDIAELVKRLDGTNFPKNIPSIAPETSDPSLDRLLFPARHFSHPDEVVGDRTLDPQEKRAILASWASDACAVVSMPALRKPPGAASPVTFDAVMDALRRLDDSRAEVGCDLEEWRARERPQGLDA